MLLKVWLVIPKQCIRLLVGMAVMAGLFLIMLLQSRTAVLATATGALYVSYPFLRNWYNKQKIIFVGLSALAVALTVLATTVKTGSSAGRSFIWKNSLNLLKENWLTGVGFRKFNPAYNHEQAKYFASHSITDSIALRANDGYYAFNEWLQIWIEMGITGFLLFGALTIFIVIICLKKVYVNTQFFGPVLIPIIVACIFSYPLHNLPVLLTSILFCIITIFNYFDVRLSIRYGTLAAFVLIGIALISKKMYAEYNRENVRELLSDGFVTEAYQICEKNIRAVHRDNNFSPLYLNILYNTGRVNEVVSEFDNIHRFHCNQSLHSILGKTYSEMNDSLNASRHFLTALYIAPYRLQSRMDLLEFYKEKGDSIKARYWAQQIKDCPMKIISGKGIILKQKADEFLTTGKIVPGFQNYNPEKTD